MKQSVFFGCETALYLLREAKIRGIKFKPSTPRHVVNYAPRRVDLLSAVEKVHYALPGITLPYPLHYLHGHTSRPRADRIFIPHLCSSELPRNSFLQITDGVYMAITPLAFAQESTRLEPCTRYELAFELCGTYVRGRMDMPTRYNITPLATTKSLANYLQNNSRIRGTQGALRALHYVTNNSASPRETHLALIMGLPSLQGGGSLGMPRMNFAVETTAAAFRLSGRRSHRCDLCWPSLKLDVEYQSHECHHGETNRIRDSRRTNALMSMGYTVIGVTNNELDSFSAMETIMQTIRKQLGKRSRTKLVDYQERKLELRQQLGLPIERW